MAWNNVNNIIQRAVDGLGFKFRINLGSAGWWNISDQINGKVDKVAGKGLSDQNFSTFEKNKLATLSEHYKGTFLSESALNTAVPTAILGDYAFVDFGPGEDTKMYVWDEDDSIWVMSSGGGIIPDATETLTGIIEIATLEEALERTDDARAMTALKTIALILDEKKSRQLGMMPIGVQEVSFAMENEGVVLGGLILGGTNLKLKIEHQGTYPAGAQEYPFAYPAMSRVFATFNFSDAFFTDCNIILKVKDN